MNLLILFAIILGMIWGLKSCLSAPKRRKPTAPKPPSHTTPDPNLSQKKGAVGEQIIKVLALKHLPASQYRHFGNLIIPHGQHTTQIDNIIVSPFGLFVIEAKHFAGWIYGQAQHKTWTHTLSHHSKFPFQNPLRQNYKHIKALSELLRLPEAHFHSIIVFTHRDCQLKTALPANVCLAQDFIAHIQTHQNTLLTPQQCQHIAQILSHENWQATPERLAQHIQQFHTPN